MQNELREVTGQYNDILKKGHEAQHQLERVVSDIKTKSAELALVNDALNKIRSQLTS
jgi:hypothetical protein